MKIIIRKVPPVFLATLVSALYAITRLATSAGLIIAIGKTATIEELDLGDHIRLLIGVSVIPTIVVWVSIYLAIVGLNAFAKNRLINLTVEIDPPPS